jgi:hypothetical protein
MVGVLEREKNQDAEDSVTGEVSRLAQNLVEP